MTVFIQTIINSILQVFLFAIIPFIWWFFSARKRESFSCWIGLRKITGKSGEVAAWTAGVSLAFALLGAFILRMLQGTGTAASQFAGMGVRAIPAILVYATLNTALSEELLFRGFLLKRLACRFGFGAANAVQAFLFGLLHGVMFASLIGPAKAIVIILFTGTIAWFMGYVNERKAGGSILPGWIIHSLSNVLSGICTAFLVF